MTNLPQELQSRLDQLPLPTLRRIAIHLHPSAEKAIRHGHPWLFDGAIARQSHTAPAGTPAILFDHKRQFLAMGLYDPHSPIRVKLLAHRPTPLSAEFFAQQLDKAWQKRTPLYQSTHTNAYRLINGENDGFPALILDRYADHYVLKLYSAIWFPYLTPLLQHLWSLTNPTRLILRFGRRISAEDRHGWEDGMVLAGTDEGEQPTLFRENGLLFEADLRHGQKTGHFLDQRENRARVRTLAQGKTVLDCFACTGGFSLHAADGKAKTITAIDLSAPALATAQRNFSHNPHTAHTPTEWIVADVFSALTQFAEQKRTFDLIILDPPAFAQKQSDLPQAISAYRRLTQLGLRTLRRGGTIIIASCSSRFAADPFFALVQESAEAIGRPLNIITQTQHAPDHPITFPEGAYLKALFAQA